MNAAPEPPIVERLDAYLSRRARSSLPLRPGEIVTVAVGVLRGCAGTPDRARGATWGLTAHGCPVLVQDPEGDDAPTATARVLSQMATMTVGEGHDLLERARDIVLTRPPRVWEQWERRLFTWAEPTPLVLGPLAPREEESPLLSDRGSIAPPSSLSALVDADLAALVADIVRDATGRWRAWRHRRAATFGVVAAAVTVTVVVALSAGERQPASADIPRTGVTTPAFDPLATPSAIDRSPGERGDLIGPPTTPGTLPSTSATWSPDSASASPNDDAVEAARTLLTSWASCSGDVSCQQSLREGSAGPQEASPGDPADAEITLVDDFGGLAVLRVDDGAVPQYLTIVRTEDRWLVRAVRTVADQPS